MTHQTLLAMALRLSEQQTPYAWASVMRAMPPTSTHPGACALVEPDGSLHGWVGGGCAKSIVIQAAQETMKSGHTKMLRISNDGSASEPHIENHAMPCASNGTIELFIQPMLPGPLLLVLGSTPSATTACELVAHIGWRTVHNPASLDDLAPDYALVATQGDDDQAALLLALGSTAKKILLIASQRKAQNLIAVMRAQGIPQQRLDAIEAPAGPDIHAHTPAEVALGAVSGLVRVHRAPACDDTAIDSDKPSSHFPPPATPSLASAQLPAYINPVCNKVIDPATARHTIEFEGAKHYFCCDGCKSKFERNPKQYAAVTQYALPSRTT